MDITLLSVVGSAIVILIALVVGFKKVIDFLSEMTQNQKQLEESLHSLITENQASLKSLVNDNSASTEKNVSVKIESLSNVVSDIKTEFINSIKEKETSTIKEIKSQNELLQNAIVEKSQKLASLVESKGNATLQELSKQLKETSKDVNSKLDGFLSTQDKNIINITSKVDSNFLNIVQLVNNLRLDNLINVTNEISKYKEGTYEDEHFLQEVGHCKIIKLTDKNSGEITNVYYDENGEKSHTETFDNDSLKYNMKYENGKLKSGVELNSDGEVLFEYIYDDAEEVSKKIEYVYEQDGSLKDKKETNY